jgi:hypothetical protein
VAGAGRGSSWLDINDTIRSSNGLTSLCFQVVGTKRMPLRPFELMVQILMGFRAGEFKEASTVSMHGLCIYHPFLVDPNIGAGDQLRMRVVPGQTERIGKIYDKMKDVSNSLLRNETLGF